MRQAHWLRVLTVAALVCAGVTMYTWAQPDDYLEKLEEAGWDQVAANVYQRNLSNGTVETLSWGLEGVSWELDRVRERITELESLRLELEGPQNDLLQSLTFYHDMARELEAQLAGEEKDLAPRRPQRDEDDELATVFGALGCNLVITRNANAGPTSTGPSANATAAFSDTCATQGKVYSQAYAEGIFSGAFRSNFERDPASGWRWGTGSASSSASASVVATSSCYSDAYAFVTVYDSNGNPANFNRSATNSTCRTSTGGTDGGTSGPGGDGPIEV